MVGTLSVLIFSSLVSAIASAAVEDMSFSQRAGYIISKGDLSHDPNHLDHMFAANRVFNAPFSFLNIEPMHEISLLVDSFYALGKDKLLFPLIPNAPVRMIEPDFSIDFFFFEAGPRYRAFMKCVEWIVAQRTYELFYVLQDPETMIFYCQFPVPRRYFITLNFSNN